MRCPNCQTLNPANAKFCLECGNRLVVCPTCGTVNLPIAKFCIECGTALQPGKVHNTPASEVSGPTAPVVVDALPSGNGTTQANTELLLPPEERRVVTVMFADITGSTPLADRLDPEDMRAILTGYFNLMTEQIRRHGGTVEKYIGDAVMAVFGSPTAHEDDPDRAIRAALDMQTALARFNEQRQALDSDANRLQMRIGINTGEVAIPNNTLHKRRDFLITGDAVNVAARLQQVATPDTILVGERTYLATREVFDFRPIAPIHIKGKAEPIMASVVLELRKPASIVTQHPRGIEGRQVRMIGRALELTLLHANYARVEAEHHPHLITILGTPGIGKSRLIREFIEREQERFKSTSALSAHLPPRVLSGHCPPYGEGITYWPLVEILRSLLEVQDDDGIDVLQQRFIALVHDTLTIAKRSESTEEVASTILRSIGRNLSGKAILPERERAKRDNQLSTHNVSAKQAGTQVALLRAWRVFIEALAEQQPLIIVIDDLQWADEALLDLLEYLTDRITSVPILFLCPARPDFFERRRDWGGGRRNFTTIELEALSQEESSELVDALLNTSDLPEILRNTILSRAEGNPFFVEEIIRMFIDQGFLVCEDDHEHGIECWRIDSRNKAHALILSGEPSDETLLGTHYLLPLPRVPDTIQGVLAARVDLLNPTEKLVLQHAAIAGRTFWLSALHVLAPNLRLETLLEVLTTLIQREFIAETEQEARSPVEYDSVFIFKHVLIRDVVYNNIPRTRRSEEHERIALWLEDLVKNDQANFAVLLAYHYQQALTNWSAGLAVAALETDDDLDTTAPSIRLTRPELRQRTIFYLMLAGDQALNTYYAIRALKAYNDAFELLNESDADLPNRIAIYERLGDAHFQRGNLDEAWLQYRKSLHLAKDHPEAATTKGTTLLYLYERMAELATRWLGYFSTSPDLQEARTYIDAGLQLLEGKPLSREKVAFLTYQAFWYIRQLEITTYTQKAELAEQALTSGHIAQRLAEELNNPSALSLVLDAMGFIYGEYHKYNEVHQIQHRRLQLESQLTEREELYDLYFSLGNAHEQIANYSSALMWFGRAWSNAQTMESPSLLLSSMTGRMRAWRQWNRWDNARQVALDILHLIEQYEQDEKRQLWALETLATIAYRTGNQEQGDHYARHYKRLIDQQIDRSDESTRRALSSTLHSIYLAREDWTHATTDYKEKLQNSEPLPAPEVLSTLAELLVTTGESTEMQSSICERAINVAEESGARKSLAIALRARGRMYMEQQEWKLAQNDLKQALRHCEVLDLPWERGNTLYQLGQLYKQRALAPKESKRNSRNADLGRARYHFEQALGFFESLKAEPSVTRARQALMQDTLTRV